MTRRCGPPWRLPNLALGQAEERAGPRSGWVVEQTRLVVVLPIERSGWRGS
ncbi:MAG: hypothetical protein ACR2M5_13900 [Nakamurella sp.]